MARQRIASFRQMANLSDQLRERHDPIFVVRLWQRAWTLEDWWAGTLAHTG
jgi:aryl carrier-like protein